VAVNLHVMTSDRLTGSNWLHAIGDHQCRAKRGEGVDQPGKEEVGVQPYEVISPATLRPKRLKRVEQAADAGNRESIGWSSHV